MPEGSAVTVRNGHGQLVQPRLRQGGRPQSDREPVRRLWGDAHASEPPVPESLALTPGGGDPCGGEGVPLDRLGLGWELCRQHEGLHALLRHRTLIHTDGAALAPHQEWLCEGLRTEDALADDGRSWRGCRNYGRFGMC